MAKGKMSIAIGSPSSADQRKWEAEDALHCITRAEELKKNAPLMREVKKLALNKQKTLASVAGATSSTPTRAKRS